MGRMGRQTWILHVDADLDQVNRHWLALHAAGMLGAAEVDGRATVYFPEPVDDLPLQGRWERLPDRDWNETWRRGLTPVRAGRWTVTPSWLATAGAGEIVIDPGQAFGTGHHETTRHCLVALDEVDLDGRTVLDVGTGSGVLAIAAARAGAQVTAVDTDRLATTAARANAQRNHARIDIVQAGVEVVVGRRFDVVVANLDSSTLIGLAAALRALLADHGLLIGSGVSNERAAQVTAAFAQADLAVHVTSGTEWSLLRARPRRTS